MAAAAGITQEMFEELELVVTKLQIIVEEHKDNPLASNLLSTIASALLLNLETQQAIISRDYRSYAKQDSQEKSLAVSADAIVYSFQNEE